MADPTDADPAVTAAKKIQERITLWKAQEHTTLDVEWVRCRGVVDELKGISSRDALNPYLVKSEQRVETLSPQRTDWGSAMTVVRKREMGHKQFTLRAAVIVGIAAAFASIVAVKKTRVRITEVKDNGQGRSPRRMVVRLRHHRLPLLRRVPQLAARPADILTRITSENPMW
jgi:hypothetical protein